MQNYVAKEINISNYKNNIVKYTRLSYKKFDN